MLIRKIYLILFILFISTQWVFWEWSFTIKTSNNKIINEVDIDTWIDNASYTYLGGIYSKDNNNVYVWDEILKWADVSTFNLKCIDINKQYCLWIDNANYYLNGVKIWDINTDLELLYWGNCVLINKQRLYCYEYKQERKLISIIDSESFEYLWNAIYIDKKYVYNLDGDIRNSEKIISKKPEEFTWLNKKYFINEGIVFFDNIEVTWVDLQSFKVFENSKSLMNDYYAIDRSNVYYLWDILEWITPVWFSIEKYENKKSYKKYFKVYSILLLLFLLEWTIILLLYNNIIKQKNIWFSIMKQVWIIISTLFIVQLIIPMLFHRYIDDDKMFILYLFFTGIVIMFITNLMKPWTVHVIKEGIKFSISIIIMRVILAFLLVALFSLFWKFLYL
jgi:hypothetical protein